MLKRGFDLIVSLFLLCLFLPLAIIIALLIKLESKGAVIYFSSRVGKNGQLFLMFRFRTKSGMPPVKTKLGRKIGNLSLDEIPALFNILKGDLSFVGPRPEIPENVNLENADWQKVLSVRPGMISPSILKYLNKFNQIPVKIRIQLDLEYAKNSSFWVDAKMIWNAVLSLIRMKGHLKGPV